MSDLKFTLSNVISFLTDNLSILLKNIIQGCTIADFQGTSKGVLHYFGIKNTYMNLISVLCKCKQFTASLGTLLRHTSRCKTFLSIYAFTEDDFFASPSTLYPIPNWLYPESTAFWPGLFQIFRGLFLSKSRDLCCFYLPIWASTRKQK